MLATCRKYEIAQSLYYRWKIQFDLKGIDGLSGQYYQVDPRVRELEKENDRLKKIIARQAPEIEVKTELLNLPALPAGRKNSSSKEEKRLIINKYRKMAALSPLLTWMFYPRGSWYCKSTSSKKGIPPSNGT